MMVKGMVNNDPMTMMMAQLVVMAFGVGGWQETATNSLWLTHKSARCVMISIDIDGLELQR